MKSRRPPPLHHTQPQPAHVTPGRRPPPLLLLTHRSPPAFRSAIRKQSPEVARPAESSRPAPAETLKPRKIAPLLHKMPEIRSTRRTRSGHRTPPPLKSHPPAAETYPGTVYISAGRSEARRDSTSSTLRPTPNPAPIPLRSFPHLYSTPLSYTSPLVSPCSTPLVW